VGNNKSKGAGYINASLVSGVHWQYVVAQGPLAHTAVSFWQMVVELGLHAVVMLTDFMEGKRTKCDPYFSPNAGSSVTFGPYEINTISVEDIAPGIVLRRLVIADGLQGTGAKYEVNHFQMMDWPDHGVPASPASLLLLTALVRGGHKDNKARDAEKAAAPPIVHCSAGIGRSGVFCAIDAVVRRLIVSAGDVAASKDAVNVGEIVALMRAQRGGMVQTPDQYRFCHTALLTLLEEAASMVSHSSSSSR
jgi:protein tyrosine phosphatase